MTLLSMDPRGGSLLPNSSVAVACVVCVRCGLVTAEMGPTTTLIFLTHGQADVCFWLFFQEQEWALCGDVHMLCLLCSHVVSAVWDQYPK